MVFFIVAAGRAGNRVVAAGPFLLVPAAGLAVAGLAIAFFEITNEPSNLVLFSGQETMGSIVQHAGTLSLGTLAFLLVFKGVGWGISLGAGRGGPTFPAIFLGIIGGLLAGHLPGFVETPAIAVLIGVGCVCVLRLPLASTVLALLVSGAGLGASPLVVVGVVVAYIATAELWARWPAREGTPDGEPVGRVDSPAGAVAGADAGSSA